jgi:hypothetical protein
VGAGGAFRIDDVSVLDTLAAGIVTVSSAQKPAGFSLSQNFPNPFNQSTVIHFTIPSRERVTLKIFNSLGEEVATLVQGMTSLLEPVMVITLGVIVGFIVVALFMPMVSLIQNVQKS